MIHTLRFGHMIPSQKQSNSAVIQGAVPLPKVLVRGDDDMNRLVAKLPPVTHVPSFGPVEDQQRLEEFPKGLLQLLLVAMGIAGVNEATSSEGGPWTITVKRPINPKGPVEIDFRLPADQFQMHAERNGHILDNSRVVDAELEPLEPGDPIDTVVKRLADAALRGLYGYLLGRLNGPRGSTWSSLQKLPETSRASYRPRNPAS